MSSVSQNPAAAGGGGTPSSSPNAPQTPGQDAAESTWSQVRGRLFSATSPVWIFAVLIVLILVFGIDKPSAFFAGINIKTMFIDAALALLLSVGMTYVIITAGIDLSVGSVLVCSGVLAAKVMISTGGGATSAFNAGWGPILAGCAVGLLVGLGWGLVNGVLVAIFSIPPLIVTLGSFGMALGVADVITGGNDVSGIPSKFNHAIGAGTVIGIPWLVIIVGLVTIAFGLILHYTRFGRYTYAVGSNAEATRRAGINVKAHLIKVYALTGLLAGLAGDLSLAYFTTTTISGHETDNLTAISAVVIGGTSLFGGSGTMFGTVVGVFIPIVLAAGLVIVGVQSLWQQVMIGAILIIAVYFDQLRRRARSR